MRAAAKESLYGMLRCSRHSHQLAQWITACSEDKGSGYLISLDAAETLSTFMVNDQPDPVRFQKAVSDTIIAAAKAVKGERPRVVACGECAPLLWARGNAEAAIR